MTKLRQMYKVTNRIHLSLYLPLSSTNYVLPWEVRSTTKVASTPKLSKNRYHPHHLLDAALKDFDTSVVPKSAQEHSKC